MIYDLDIVYLIIFLESLNEYLCSYGWSNSSHIHWLIHCFWDISGMIYIQICHLFANKNGGLSPNLRGIKNWDCMWIWNQHYDIWFCPKMRYTSKMAICIGKIILLQQSLLGNGNSHVSTWRGVAAFLSTAFKHFLQLWCADSRVLIQKSSKIISADHCWIFLGGLSWVSLLRAAAFIYPWHVWWVQPTGVFYHCGSDRLGVIYFMLLNLICCHCASLG